ncbi:hypothetical protein ACHAPT_003805 [Fusarium lateritium]
MAPERRRDNYPRRAAPYHRRRSARGQDQDTDESNRHWADDGSNQPPPTPSTRPNPSAEPSSSRRAGAAASEDGNLDDASRSSQARQFPVPDIPGLSVVERATVLYAPARLSTKNTFSVLDISFGTTRKTDFCARIEGPRGIWVAKSRRTGLLCQLIDFIAQMSSINKVNALFFSDGSDDVITMHSNRSQAAISSGGTVGMIIWPRSPDDLEWNMDKTRVRELVEQIGGCWNV